MVENGIKFGETKNHPIYEWIACSYSASRADMPGVSEKNSSGSLSVTFLQISAQQIFFSQSFKISLKLTKSPTTGWLEQVEEVPKYYVSGENGDHTTSGSAVKNWGEFFTKISFTQKNRDQTQPKKIRRCPA